MHISRLRMVNIRSFESLHLELGPKFNVFIGENGVGKTSILEAIDVLSRGKSFRTSNLNEIIRQNQTDLAIASSVISADKNEISLSFTRKRAVTELKVNSFVTSKWSEITSYLPIISIHPESYLVITGGPNERRKYIDWGLFHVEPSFKTSWSSYVRALKQRNACLRNKRINDAKQWHGVLNEYGLNIHHARLKYLEAITPIIQFYASKLNLNQNIDVGYQQGWPSEHELLDSLEKELKPDDFPLTTSVGPHRANLSIKWDGKKFATTSSRGQQKALAIAMYLAQSQYMVDHFSKNSVYLVDELPAELDQSTCQQVLLLLSELNSQVVITSVSEHYLRDPTPENTKWFHVEHGHASPIRPML